MMWLLWAIVAFVALQRVAELAYNRRNQRRLIDRGGRLVHEDRYEWLVAIHASWFLGMVVEGLGAPWAGPWEATWLLLGLYAVAEVLRLWTMVTLGERWTTRVIVLPGAEPITSGPFRWMDHPIYTAVAIELVALPLAFGLPVTAIAIGVANALGLRARIKVEEQAMADAQDA